MEQKRKDDKDEESFYLVSPSMLAFPKNTFAIDHQSPWKSSIASHPVNQQQSRQLLNDEHRFETTRTNENTWGSANHRRDARPIMESRRLKRSRIDGPPPTYHDEDEFGEKETASKLELYAIQLFTLILARFNNNVNGEDDEKLVGDDYFISSGFQKLRDMILCEMNHIEETLGNRMMYESDDKVKDTEKSPVMIFDELNVDDLKKSEEDTPTSSPSCKDDVLISSHTSLLKFNKMLLLLLGYTVPKEDLNLPHFYITADINRGKLTNNCIALFKYLLDLIDLLYHYNTKRYTVWTKKLQFQNGYMPFQLSGADLDEYFTMIQRVLFQIACDLMKYLSYISKEEDFIVSKMIEYFSIIQKAVSILHYLEESWISTQQSPTRSVNLLDLIIEVIATVKEVCVERCTNVELEQQFNNLVAKILSFLHASSNQSTYSIVSSCAEIVFHHNMNGDNKSGNQEIVHKNYDLLLRFLASLHNIPLVTAPKRTNWTTLFDTMNTIIKHNSMEVKKILIICNYLVRSNCIRTDLISNKTFLKSILQYTSNEGLETFNQTDINWINTKAIRIIAFLMTTNPDQIIFHKFIGIANMKTSMIVKAEFILTFDAVMEDSTVFLLNFLDEAKHDTIESFYDVYKNIATYQGTSFHTLSYARKAALRSLCNLSWHIKDEKSFDTCIIKNSVLPLLDLGKCYEEIFIEVLFKNISGETSAVSTLMKENSILSRLSRISTSIGHSNQSRENTMLFLRHISQDEEILIALTYNENFIECLMHYLSVHGKSKKAAIMKYCVLEISVMIAQSKTCRQHIINTHNNALVNLLIDAESKLSVHFESELDSEARIRTNIQIPTNEKLTIKRRLQHSLSNFES